MSVNWEADSSWNYQKRNIKARWLLWWEKFTDFINEIWDCKTKKIKKLSWEKQGWREILPSHGVLHFKIFYPGMFGCFESEGWKVMNPTNLRDLCEKGYHSSPRDLSSLLGSVYQQISHDYSYISYPHLLHRDGAFTKKCPSTSDVFHLPMLRLAELLLVIVHNHALQQRHEREGKWDDQKQVSGLYIADTWHRVIGVLKKEDFCEKSCDTQGPSVTNFAPIHPKWQPRDHRAKDAGKENTDDVMANSSSHEEGHVQIIKPT